MNAKIIILSIITLLLLLTCDKLYAQDYPKSNKRAEKELVKQRKEKGKEARKSDKEAIKHHYKSQGKSTSRRMKKNQRKTKRIKKNKRPFFLKSWFSSFNLELYKIEVIT